MGQVPAAAGRPDLFVDDAQARERTQILFNTANQVGGLVVGTGDLSELAGSIRSKGVLEPILVRRTEPGSKMRIISGERRYRAAMEAGLAEIPVIEMESIERVFAVNELNLPSTDDLKGAANKTAANVGH